MVIAQRSLVVLLELRTLGGPACRAISTAASLQAPAANSGRNINECFERLDLSFKNTKNAFKGKQTRDLVRALVVLPLCSMKMLVKKNDVLYTTMKKVFGERFAKKLLKATFFGQFVGGETLDEVKQTMLKLKKYSLKSMLDYSVESDVSESEAQNKAIEGDHGSVIKTQPVENVVEKKVVDSTHQRYTVHKEFADRRKDVMSARTYFYESEAQCDRNGDIFCQSVDAIASSIAGEGFNSVKLTALGRPQLLLKLTEIIAQSQNFYKAVTGMTMEDMVLQKMKKTDFIDTIKKFDVKIDENILQQWLKTVDFDQYGFVDFYDWGKLMEEDNQLDKLFQVFNTKTKKMEPMLNVLSAADAKEADNMMKRIVRVVEYGATKNVRTMIDAEQTYFQPAISRLVRAMMRKYNKQKGLVFNTYQAYLKSCMNDVELDMNIAKREDYHFGCKLVRGAYMEQERKRAKMLNYDDPINPNFEATSEMYDKVMHRIVKERLERGLGKVSVMVATHNEISVKTAVELMREHNIAPDEKTVCFAQLYGMCDQVSFSLAQAGFSAYKYLPYGPMDDVLPYLSRRAQENGSVLSKTRRECALMLRELLRRTVTFNDLFSSSRNVNVHL